MNKVFDDDDDDDDDISISPDSSQDIWMEWLYN